MHRRNLEPEFEFPKGTDTCVRTIERDVQNNAERILKNAPVSLELIGYQPENRWVFDAETQPEGIDYFAMEEVFPTVAQFGEPGSNAQKLDYMNVRALLPPALDGPMELEFIEFHWQRGVTGTLLLTDDKIPYVSIEQGLKPLATHELSQEVFDYYVKNCGLPRQLFGTHYERKLAELARQTAMLKQHRAASFMIDPTSRVSLSHHAIHQTDPTNHYDSYETMDVTLDHIRDDAIFRDLLTFARHSSKDEWEYRSMHARNINDPEEKLTVPTSSTMNTLSEFFETTY